MLSNYCYYYNSLYDFLFPFPYFNKWFNHGLIIFISAKRSSVVLHLPHGPKSSTLVSYCSLQGYLLIVQFVFVSKTISQR